MEGIFYASSFLLSNNHLSIIMFHEYYLKNKLFFSSEMLIWDVFRRKKLLFRGSDFISEKPSFFEIIIFNYENLPGNNLITPLSNKASSFC